MLHGANQKIKVAVFMNHGVLKPWLHNRSHVVDELNFQNVVIWRIEKTG